MSDSERPPVQGPHPIRRPVAVARMAERTSRRGIYRPCAVEVDAGADGVPGAVGRSRVESVREEWLVEDRWWTPSPLSRRYFELVLADGRDLVFYREPAVGGGWFEQRC